MSVIIIGYAGSNTTTPQCTQAQDNMGLKSGYSTIMCSLRSVTLSPSSSMETDGLDSMSTLCSNYKLQLSDFHTSSGWRTNENIWGDTRAVVVSLSVHRLLGKWECSNTDTCHWLSSGYDGHYILFWVVIPFVSACMSLCAFVLQLLFLKTIHRYTDWIRLIRFLKNHRWCFIHLVAIYF